MAPDLRTTLYFLNGTPSSLLSAMTGQHFLRWCCVTWLNDLYIFEPQIFLRGKAVLKLSFVVRRKWYCRGIQTLPKVSPPAPEPPCLTSNMTVLVLHPALRNYGSSNLMPPEVFASFTVSPCLR